MLRKQSSASDSGDWFYSAADRLRVADLAWQAEGVTQSGIELLQEAVERYLKGYLIAQGWRLRRVHDLGPLLADAMQFEPRFAKFRNLADELTEEFFAQHYPGGDWTALGENYQHLRAQTGQLIVLIQEQLPQFFPQGNSHDQNPLS